MQNRRLHGISTARRICTERFSQPAALPPQRRSKRDAAVPKATTMIYTHLVRENLSDLPGVQPVEDEREGLRELA